MILSTSCKVLWGLVPRHAFVAPTKVVANDDMTIDYTYPSYVDIGIDGVCITASSSS